MDAHLRLQVFTNMFFIFQILLHLNSASAQYMVTRQRPASPFPSPVPYQYQQPKFPSITLPAVSNSLNLQSIPSIRVLDCGCSYPGPNFNSCPASNYNTCPKQAVLNVPNNVFLPEVTAALSLPVPKLVPTNCGCVPPVNDVSLDLQVLNNMAIALQLLIVSTFLALPNTDPSVGDYVSRTLQNLPPIFSDEVTTYPRPSCQQSSYVVQGQPLSYPQQQPTCPYAGPSNPQNPYVTQGSYGISPVSSLPPPAPIPNANFLGSSCGGNPLSYGVPTPTPRVGLALMSPYEAIRSDSPFSDPILSSPYGNIITSKRDFQSPYELSSTSTDSFWNF